MSNIPFTVTVQNNDDSALGKGARGPIPLTLVLEATNIVVKPDAPLHLDIFLRSVPKY
jgi:hypothetical protein